MFLALAAVIALVVGMVVGMLGGGGSVLLVPVFIYLLGVAERPAIASSLFVVAVTSAAAAAAHARSGRVRWSMGVLFAALAVPGGFVGARLAHFVPDAVLLALFGTLMVVTSLAMLRGRAPTRDVPPVKPNLALVPPIGLAVGLFAGLIGAGGGFLVVPALVIVGGLAMDQAIGTSLLVITLQSLSGFAGHLGRTTLDVPLIAVSSVAAMTGSLFGARMVPLVDPLTLRRTFGGFVLLVGAFVIGRQIPGGHYGALATGLALLLLALERLSRVHRSPDARAR